MDLIGVNKRLAALLLFQVIGVSLYDLDIRVEHGFHVATWECTAEIPLSACHVAWMDFGRDREVTVLDLQEQPGEETQGMLDYEYAGRGLQYGDCGVKIRVQGYSNWMVGCRVKARGSGWKYAWSDFTGTDLFRLKNGMSVEPRMALALPGHEAKAVCKARMALDSCLIGQPEMEFGYVAIRDGEEVVSERFAYHGAGLGEGDCGFRIREAREEDNGVLRCEVQDVFNGASEWRNVPVVVAVRPESVTLEGQQVDGVQVVTCTAVGGRPLASIAWRLDDQLLRQDDISDLEHHPDSWRWPWMSGDIRQKIQWDIRPEEHGATISCIVTHPALEEPVVIQDNIVYSDPPEYSLFNITVVIDDLYSTTSTTERSTSSDSTTETTSSSTTETSTSTESTSTTSTTTTSTTTTSTTTTSTTTEGPHTDCCCYVRRCHSLFRDTVLKKFCTNTFTCEKVKICCPQL